MKKTFTKILSVVLCAVMVLGAAPLGGLVGLDLPGLFDFKAEAAIYRGTCGDKLTWLLNTSTGVLKIIGTGSMQNYSSESTPWYLYRGYIKTVNIPDGLTTIGNYAFYDCSSLTSVTIPNGVASIGDFAFRYCSKLTSVTIPDSVITIGDDAFYDCYNLTSVTIPDSVITIGDNAFDSCFNLTSVTIGDSVTTIGFATFSYCYNLTSITIPNSVTNIGYGAFDDCDSLIDIYYGSTEEDWNAITIGLENDYLTSATIHYNHVHTLSNVKESVDPTCDKTGYKTGNCVCGYSVTEESPVRGHDIVIDKAVEPDCTETGLTEGQHCSRCDGMTVEQEVVPVKPHSYTANSDSAKHWEECVCGSKINVQNHSFVGGNVCSCGFKRTVDSTIKIKNNSGSKTINYGETLKLTATVTDKPANAKIYWYVDGEQKGEGEIFDVKIESGTKIITVKLVDENGVVYQNANDEEISESENVTVKAGFFQKLISFFKNLFRMNRTVIQ